MRIFSIITAVLVLLTLYLVVFERDRLLGFARGEEVAEEAPAAAPDEQPADAAVSVVALSSTARDIEQVVLVRGRTEAARQVDLRAETSGTVVSEPLRKGAFVEAGQALCRIDPGTREVTLAEATARLAEAKSRLPEAEARLAEALAGVPAAEAAILEARANIPAAEARLAEARAAVPAAKARLAEARAGLPAAEAGVSEAEARINEAGINLNAANKLAKGGFASETRVAGAEAASEAARAGLEAAKSQLEGARAAIEAAISQVEGAGAAVETAKSGVEGAKAGVATALSRLESANAAVQSARSGVQNARAGIQSAEAGVAGADKEIERLEIHAPFAGLLESDSAELGSLLQPGSLCATVIQLDPIKLVGFVPETEVDKVRVGVRAGARLATGHQVVGNVSFLARAADPATRTFRVEVTVDNTDLTIRDGQTAEIAIESDTLTAHLIPQSALTLDDDGKLGVRIVDAENHAGFVPVQVLRDATEGIYVSGLAPVADVIVVGQEFVTDGVAVAPSFREGAGQ